MQQLVQERDEGRVRYEVGSRGRLGEQRVHPLGTVAFEVVATEGCCSQYRRQLLADSFHLARAQRVADHRVTLAADLLNRRTQCARHDWARGGDVEDGVGRLGHGGGLFSCAR